MVVGAYCCREADIAAVLGAGAADSKTLSAKRRVARRPALAALGEWTVASISAREIDAENINTLEERTFAALIARFSPDHVIIDAPVHPRGIPNFTGRLEDQLRKLGAEIPQMTIEPKADVNYPPVGAASIFAKVARDEAIAALGPVGSGYPSDPKTRAWLKDLLDRDVELPACVRTRWGTIENLRQQPIFKGS
jgi:ribonuclease HII